MGRLEHIVVDLTLLGPGGENGGAGLVATSLVRNFSALRPDLRQTLLTARASHAELASLESPAVRRVCVTSGAPVDMAGSAQPRRSMRSLSRASLAILPETARFQVKQIYHHLRANPTNAETVRDLVPDLVFSPFTAPIYCDPSVPLVSIVYDLQHLAHPEFFTAEQRASRQHHIRQACRRADRVVCISEFVRQTLVASVPEVEPRALVVPLGLLDDDVPPRSEVLERLRLRPGSYVLYPANFWRHKNHLTLFEALARHRARRPGSELVLVCTGVPNSLSGELARQAPAGLVVFPGYVDPGELRALLAASRGLVFPSLYEGYGLPVLEAMAAGKPVLCSGVTNLPHVAADAARYFDPTDPDDIAAALAFLEDEPEAVADMVARGRVRAAQLGTARDTARHYLDIFDQVIADRAA